MNIFGITLSPSDLWLLGICGALITEVNPKYANAYYNRGLAYNKLGNHKQAIKDFDKAIELNPLDAESYSIRGIVYIQLKNYQQGIEDLKIGATLGDKRAQYFLRSKGIDW